jgi:hypothetical protein
MGSVPGFEHSFLVGAWRARVERTSSISRGDVETRSALKIRGGSAFAASPREIEGIFKRMMPRAGQEDLLDPQKPALETSFFQISNPAARSPLTTAPSTVGATR